MRDNWDRAEVEDALPKLRRAARLVLLGDTQAADKLVERVLIEGHQQARAGQIDGPMDKWLLRALFRMSRH